MTNCNLTKTFLILCLLLWLRFPAISLTGELPKLQKYTCLTGFNNIAEKNNDKSVKFDSAGILTDGVNYHPLSIIQHGILWYYHFVETGDTLSRRRFLEQVSYFRDTSKVDILHGGKSVGLPYQVKFKDLKVPWYSGMTQGNAISFLLRYYDYSRDDSILPVIQKICHLLLLPVKEGGAISKTPEGFTWIEEYPGSVLSKQVLNGFINAWIGLHEYCLFFPADTLASRIRDESLHALKNSLKYYETEDGTFYNRNKAKCANGYIRYQILEMEQLYAITGESLFRRQMMLWSHMIYNKPITDKKSRLMLKDFNFAVPLRDSLGKKFPAFAFDLILPEQYIEIKVNDRLQDSLQRLVLLSGYSDSLVTVIPRNKKDRNKLMLSLNFADSVAVKRLSLKVRPPMNIGMEDVVIKYPVRKESRKKSTFRPQINQDGEYLCMNFPEKWNNPVSLTFKTRKSRTQWEIGNLMAIAPETKKTPYFAFWESEIMPAADTISFSIDSRFAGTPVVFYRTHADSAKFAKLNWKLHQNVTGNHGIIISGKDKKGLIQFLVFFYCEGPQTVVSRVEIKK